MLVPLGLKWVEEQLAREVEERVGRRYSRGGKIGRWGSNRGSVYLGDQKVRVRVPRIRSKEGRAEVGLNTYRMLQEPGLIDRLTLERVIHGLSTGRYRDAAVAVPETFGISRASISRRFVRASEQQLKNLMERDLSIYDLVAIFLDGKSLGREQQLVIALGVTLAGEKVVLGFVESSTENHRVCQEFLQGLKGRGLRLHEDILVVLDGGKGLRKAVEQEFGGQAIVQRCVWHKRENVMAYLKPAQQAEYRARLQAAYNEPDYDKAKAELRRIRVELGRINLSAVRSLEEGMEETLTLHRLGMVSVLGRSFQTTNAIENINGLLQRKIDRVTYWKNSSQRQRWAATALLAIEWKLRHVALHGRLPWLREAIKEYRQRQTGAVAQAA
jgi:transposase-like protein